LYSGVYVVNNLYFILGYLKPNVKWGAWPKVIGCGLFGYFIGKYSYQTKCAEKLMQLPNSEIGRILRERSGRTKGEYYDKYDKYNESFNINLIKY